MKKSLISLLCLLMASATLSTTRAQEDDSSKKQGIFNRLSIGVSASTMGVGIDAATTIGPYLMLRAGVETMPSITFDADVDVDVDVNYPPTRGGISPVTLTGDLKRTQTSVLLNVYPFRRSSFFLTGGAYFGGNKVIAIEGKSDELKDLYNQYGDQAGLIIGDYKLPIDRNGHVKGSIEVQKFRPYVGFGFGRAVPHKRVGFAFEMGVQFHGKPKVQTEIGELDELVGEADDDFSEIMDKLNVYPVIKFRLCGRIF